MHDTIRLQDGEGLKASRELISSIFVKKSSSRFLKDLPDAARIGSFVFSCDSFTVDPIFFPPCDIAYLSIFGTVNDICVSAGAPLYMSVAVIVEEGFPRQDLVRLSDSLNKAAKTAQVHIVTGDFKVVEKGKIDKIFICTSGVGRKITSRAPSVKNIRDKDAIIITGAIAEHGISIMLRRKKIFEFNLKSDCQSLRKTLIPLWKKFPGIRFMRDPTRGGIAATLHEMRLGAGMGVRIFEERIPIRPDVEAACEILGIDPLYLASEGRALIVVDPKDAPRLLQRVRTFNKYAAIIGEVDRRLKHVVIETTAGGERVVDFSRALNIPRIC